VNAVSGNYFNYFVRKTILVKISQNCAF